MGKGVRGGCAALCGLVGPRSYFPEELVRHEAGWGLRRLADGLDERNATKVVERLAHPSSCVRELALWVLPNLHAKVDERAVLAATPRLTDAEWKARQEAHIAVAQFAAL